MNFIIKKQEEGRWVVYMIDDIGTKALFMIRQPSYRAAKSLVSTWKVNASPYSDFYSYHRNSISTIYGNYYDHPRHSDPQVIDLKEKYAVPTIKIRGH